MPDEPATGRIAVIFFLANSSHELFAWPARLCVLHGLSITTLYFIVYNAPKFGKLTMLHIQPECFQQS
jgi:hypothetical protein